MRGTAFVPLGDVISIGITHDTISTEFGTHTRGRKSTCGLGTHGDQAVVATQREHRLTRVRFTMVIASHTEQARGNEHDLMASAFRGLATTTVDHEPNLPSR